MDKTNPLITMGPNPAGISGATEPACEGLASKIVSIIARSTKFVFIFFC